MALLVPREGDVQLLTDLLGGGTLENWLLGLFHANITPSETDTAATYTAQEATFTSYARKTLTRSIGASTWNTPVSQAPSGSPAWSARSQVGHSQYGASPQTWVCGATGDTIYGYFIVGATSGKLICAEAFATPRTLASGDTLSIIPVFENA
ncbi:hypothetical protein OJF2_72580 [Aquisphaera giovannonii]|uniref:Uncharacterized protein n=1 Tax=Aquisphaera giovannonii TaxID=406548 RepID=A0A5B9WDK3_9BACT|nr:hypothetical protein [Aquisphaera giovannonii]QEH38652.1 hypothetical protein OJF2_72580 [Aquisphaera giovannonii]